MSLENSRLDAIRLWESGLNQSEVARRVKVVRQTVARWVRQYRDRGGGTEKGWTGRTETDAECE